MADDQDQQEQPTVPSISDYGRTLSAGYDPEEIRASIAKDSGLTGDDLDNEYRKLNAAITVRPPPGSVPPTGDTGGLPKAPDPVPGSYNPEQEQTALRSVQSIDNPERRLRVESYIKQEFANMRIMDGVTQAAREKVIKTGVAQYSKAIEEIRDDPKASLEQKQKIVTMLTQTMWQDPRLMYGETQGQLEKYMETLAFGEDNANLGPKYAQGFHAIVTGEIRTPQQILEMQDRGDVTGKGAKALFDAFGRKDRPDQAAINQGISWANMQIKNAVMKGTEETGITGIKPTQRMYEKETEALQALNRLILAAGGDQEKVAKLTSHDAVNELIERVYPLYERNADYVTRNADRALANVQVPNTIALDERSQTAYRDIAGLPPTIPDPNDGDKPKTMAVADWQRAINDLLSNPTPARIASFTKRFGTDGKYIVKSIKLGPGPEPTPAVQPSIASFGTPPKPAAAPHEVGPLVRPGSLLDRLFGGGGGTPQPPAPARPAPIGPNAALEE